MNRGKVLALDYGQNEIGLAIGSFELKVALPKGVLLNADLKETILYLKRLINDEGVSFVLVGYPLNVGAQVKKNEMMRQVEMFAKNLQLALEDKIEVEVFDESLTTFEAKERIKEMQRETGKKSSITDHEIAAQIILERFFDTSEG